MELVSPKSKPDIVGLVFFIRLEQDAVAGRTAHVAETKAPDALGNCQCTAEVEDDTSVAREVLSELLADSLAIKNNALDECPLQHRFGLRCQCAEMS